MSVMRDPYAAETTYTGRANYRAERFSIQVDYVEISNSTTTPPPIRPREEPIPPPEIDTPPSNPSPIIIDMDNNGFDLVGIADAVFFDITGDGAVDQISWTAGQSLDAFLALDRNQNGIVDNGGELFGTATPLHGGGFASNGYIALSEYDAAVFGGNGDGVLTPADAIWHALSVWTDVNHNGVSEPAEIKSVSAAGLLALDFEFSEKKKVDEHGNEFRYKSHARISKPGGGSRTTQTYDVFFVFAP